uniref:Conotoxin ArMKLT2-0311 n=1 Tax=Conus arenatus TaxID=89451 RepID=O1613_CONAE|nr:RecName: Full=Conotoxin ArMKLT2-0311; Flags: Precursor [Conus arenatus]AAG60483.1 conotoxin scaffold VI/VII precursor [Conus arenatus]
MKLTCVLIVALLFLTACQLTTADDSRDKQEDPLVRSHRKMQKSEDPKMAERCSNFGSDCIPATHDCCSGECFGFEDMGLCT